MTHLIVPLALLDVGGGEMILIFFIVLLLFGGKKMPEFARGLGKSIREFKKATSGVEDEIKRALQDPPPTPAKPPVYTPPATSSIENKPTAEPPHPPLPPPDKPAA